MLHPRFSQRLSQLERILTRVVGQHQVAHYLSGTHPHQIQFPNLPSAVIHADFFRSEVTKNLAIGTIQKWHWPHGQPPTVINPIGVAVRADTGKPRAILACMYPNMFLKYRRFTYESIPNVLNYIEQGDYMTLSDLKAGYFAASCYEEATYLGFEFEGTVYTYLCWPFGVQSCCRDFTELISEVSLPLRKLGMRMTNMIDDKLQSCASFGLLQHETLTNLALMGALGFVFGTQKCLFWPTQEAPFLGLEIDTISTVLRLPAAKVQFILQRITALLLQPHLSARMLAQVAGKLIAARPALHMSLLFCRALFHAISEQASWDSLFPCTAAIRETLQYWLDHLESSNGAKSWRPLRRSRLVIAGDASKLGFGAWTPHAEWPADMAISFTPEQMAAVATHAFSSTARELECLYLSIRVALEQCPERVVHCLLVYWTDSQCLVATITNMGGNPALFPYVKKIWLLCLEHDIDLQTVWFSRADPLIERADLRSRQVDNSEYAIAVQEVDKLVSLWSPLGARQPELDPFAGQDNHKAPTFYSLYLCPGTAGVDGFLQPWLTPTNPHPFCWVNGPFSDMAAIIRKLISERADCILIAPDWPKDWVAMLPTLPIRAEARLASYAGICIPGPRVDPAIQQSGRPKYALKAYLILWGHPSAGSHNASN
jgi:hypothetical protein